MLVEFMDLAMWILAARASESALRETIGAKGRGKEGSKSSTAQLAPGGRRLALDLHSVSTSLPLGNIQSLKIQKLKSDDFLRFLWGGGARR